MFLRTLSLSESVSYGLGVKSVWTSARPQKGPRYGGSSSSPSSDLTLSLLLFDESVVPTVWPPAKHRIITSRQPFTFQFDFDHSCFFPPHKVKDTTMFRLWLRLFHVFSICLINGLTSGAARSQSNKQSQGFHSFTEETQWLAICIWEQCGVMLKYIKTRLKHKIMTLKLGHSLLWGTFRFSFTANISYPITIAGYDHTNPLFIKSNATEFYKSVDLLMELCPLSELLRLSTEPPCFSLGFSKESESVWGEWGQLKTRSGLDYKKNTLYPVLICTQWHRLWFCSL